MKKLVLIVFSAFLLVACGEKPQSVGGSQRDEPAFMGTGMAAFTAPGWKPGDKTSWELGLRARMQYGQNEYSRSN